MEKQNLEKQYSNSSKKVNLCLKKKCGSLGKKAFTLSNIYNKEIKKQCPKHLSVDDYSKCSDLFDRNSKTAKLREKALEKSMNCKFSNCKKERQDESKSFMELKSYEKEHMSGGNDTSTNSNNKNSVKECETKFCKSYLLPTLKKSTEETIKKIEKRFTRKMSPSEKKDYFEKKKEKQKARLKEKAKTIKKEEKRNLDDCVSTYCNKGCKNTIYEDGEGYPASLETYFRNKYEKTFKDDKKFINHLIEGNKQQRTELFKNKSTVLKDNFYQKLNKKTLKLLKSKKAISGCSNWKISF
jgi:hypothetical protein